MSTLIKDGNLYGKTPQPHMAYISPQFPIHIQLPDQRLQLLNRATVAWYFSANPKGVTLKTKSGEFENMTMILRNGRLVGIKFEHIPE